MRLMHLEGLLAHVKESVRQGLARLQTVNKKVQAPPHVFPNDGDGGLIEWIDKYAESVAAMQVLPSLHVARQVFCSLARPTARSLAIPQDERAGAWPRWRLRGVTKG